MRKKKVLLHGTLDSLQKFFADAVSRDFEIAAVLSEEPEKISIKLDVLKPQSLPKFVYNLVDGIIFTGDKSAAEFFLKQGVAPRKIILYDAAQGWQVFGGQDNDGTRVAFVCGLEFHATTTTLKTSTRFSIDSKISGKSKTLRRNIIPRSWRKNFSSARADRSTSIT